jgi:hypothetical protein
VRDFFRHVLRILHDTGDLCLEVGAEALPHAQQSHADRARGHGELLAERFCRAAVSQDDCWLLACRSYEEGLLCVDLTSGESRDLTALWANEDAMSGAIFALYPVPGTTRVFVGGQRGCDRRMM